MNFAAAMVHVTLETKNTHSNRMPIRIIAKEKDFFREVEPNKKPERS